MRGRISVPAASVMDVAEQCGRKGATTSTSAPSTPWRSSGWRGTAATTWRSPIRRSDPWQRASHSTRGKRSASVLPPRHTDHPERQDDDGSERHGEDVELHLLEDEHVHAMQV